MMLVLKPAPGRRVRHADGRLFASDGERVPATPHYLRLRAVGDLVGAGDLAPPSAPAKPTRPSRRKKPPVLKQHSDRMPKPQGSTPA